MEARQEKIIDAHAQTFNWIFHPNTSSSGSAPENGFLQWLIKGSDIFWITGKPGSGKSTLMKFLSHHGATLPELKRWAENRALVTADFYFWHAGTELQKSQEGLLQSLLYGILSQCPETMPNVLPKRWEQSKSNHAVSHPWSRTELLAAFTELSAEITKQKRFCFFIDGLDEYDGDHSEIVDLLKWFSQSKDIKICLSSRPWNVFTRAFGLGSNPIIRLEDLTWRDIQTYVRDTLGSNRLFCQLIAGKDSARCENLQNEIVSRAQGVFLWVFLVTRSLLQGLTNADRITDLERRLRSLPIDLETYFRHMLDNIEDIYKQQTVQTFHTALQAAEPLNLMTYVMVDELEENPNYAIELPVQQMSRGQIESRCQEMKLRINARCKDLLQVSRKVSKKTLHNSMLETSLDHSSGSEEVSSGEPSLQPLFPYEVDFLHRTVRDFFQVNDIQIFVASRLPRSFSYSNMLCHAFLGQIKVAPIEAQPIDQVAEVSDLIDDLMHYAYEAEKQTVDPDTVLLDELANTIKHLYGHLQLQAPGHFTIEDLEEYTCTHPSTHPSIPKICQSVLGFAVQKDLQLYVGHKLDKRLHQGLPAWENETLVMDALQPSIPSKYSLQSPNRKMLRLLVGKGVDLNKPRANSDGILAPSHMWGRIIKQTWRHWHHAGEDIKIQQLEIMHALLELGVEFHRPERQDSLDWVQFILIPCENWRSDSRSLEAALTKTILAFCERRIDPYWKLEEKTLWLHLISSINLSTFDNGRPSKQFCLETKGFLLVIVKKFLGLGAQLNDILFYGSTPQYHSTVTEILARFFTTTEVEELRLLQTHED